MIVDEQRSGLPRDVVVRALRREGIDVRCYFSPPVHRHQSYAARHTPALPVTERVASQVVSLPTRIAPARKWRPPMLPGHRARHGEGRPPSPEPCP